MNWLAREGSVAVRVVRAGELSERVRGILYLSAY